MRNRIKEVRNDRKLSQADFGKELSISRSAVCKIESGENAPSEQTLQLICNRYSVNMEWLKTGNGEKYESVSSKDYMDIIAKIEIKDKKAKQAIIDYWNLSEQDKELFWNFIDRFLKSEKK